ncbi:hypothetical protein yc1106_04872 [Curvularia clavata]|uniref:Heterokaryon incompatibility domain-containing protein n=1 Tax=Curvularia clavata TaxID=95742 RepID=A0A9Q8ZC49_CURCL|nr:hypothetical protein yc1106_04872 [Curvularia clavata]
MTSTPLYAPLQHQDTIRLIRLKPRNDENGIEVILKSFRLSSAIKFNALSYVWGSPTPQRWISCNGHQVSITPNLHSALSQLLQQGFDCLLWVDALCINQQDDEEKSAQVAMMRGIFSRAAKVIFWLGEEQDFDKDGARLMNTFFQKHPELLFTGELRDKSLRELGMPYFDTGWVGWASLLIRPWFGRVWIAQEFSSAKESVFMSGAVEIPTKVLMHCAIATNVCVEIQNVFAIQTESGLSAATLRQRPLHLCITQDNEYFVRKEDIDIDDIWKRSHLLEATDERDRVFALLSLQTMLPMDLIDYSKDIVEVYTEVAKIALTHPIALEQPVHSKVSSQPSRISLGNKTYRSSRFLACKCYSLSESQLPSWVPDWRPNGIRFAPLTDYYLGISFFDHPYQDAIIENRTMSISGVFVDKPSVIVDSMPYMEDVLSNVRREERNPLQVSHKWGEECSMSQASIAGGILPHDEYIGGFQALRKRMLQTTQQDDRHRAVFEGSESSNRRYFEYESRFAELSQGRKFCVTETGKLAWIPQAAKPGDEICFLAGCAVPFVIRRAGDSWRLLGDCYLDGLMSDVSMTFLPQPQLLKFT